MHDKCLIYLLLSKICGVQYTDSTTDPFCCHWSNYKDNNRKAERGVAHIQANLSEYFTSLGHTGFLEDCNITVNDKTDASDSPKREEYCRRLVKTELNTVA